MLNHFIFVLDTRLINPSEGRYMRSLNPAPVDERRYTQHVRAATLALLAHDSLNTTTFVTATDTIINNGSSAPSSSNSHTALPEVPSFKQAVEYLGLHPEILEFTCCSECWALYPMDKDSPESYPERCTYTDIDERVCDTELRAWEATGNGANPRWHPKKRYLMQDIKHWLARLYCREDLAQYLDKDHFYDDDESVGDILDSPLAQEFPGLNGKTPFVRGKGNVLLCINQDGFPAFDQSRSSKTYTVGGIYISCMRLPPALRNRYENMCMVGLSHGPGEPKGPQMNAILNPLVDILLVLWYDGIFLTEACGYPHGRRLHAAVCLGIFDWPAFSSMCGYPNHENEIFCPCCNIPYSDIDNTHFRSWVPRHWPGDKASAIKWNDASSQGARDAVEKLTGIRWSVLWRLPYWQGFRMAPSDRMHMFDLRMGPRHCRDIWGMSDTIDDGDPLSDHNYGTLPASALLDGARTALKTGPLSSIASFEDGVLRALSREHNLQYGGHRAKSRMIKQLKDYVSVITSPFPQPFLIHFVLQKTIHYHVEPEPLPDTRQKGM